MRQGRQDCSIKLRVPTFGRKSLIFDPLLDAGTLEATAQKASATFFQHFVGSGISSNLSLSTGRNWAYQPINATLPSCLMWDDSGPVCSKLSVWPVSHIDRIAEAQTWRRVSVLRMSAVAVWLSAGILAWLSATVVVVAAALRWHLRGLRGDVERVVDVLLMVAGSDRLLRLVNEGGESVAAKQGVMTRLGWFEDRDGSMRWGIEVVEDEGATRDN
ncbi:hypothetical protein DIS24_g10809 [Lasiodiplodia hormozganensis]|uniref:Uncharacterized protein n=1 Tax=Lasiodiplodia hormozganensis TaxID=869390 RepID=A0AA39X6H6_9PEZI|nr:hypothetical protein DIS24_g10809 [Lasiodiplodia hormozganensis]